MGRPIDSPLPEQDELLWDDGSAQPEYCLDQFPLVGKWEALGYLMGGFAVFGLIGVAAVYNDKPHKKPFVPREFPFDGLKEELGSGFGPAALEERMAAGSPHSEEDE
ncbi:g5111 [Coccomyxa viridis]|uniref:G5111 protein n=1 Tax=Coccomyxa viridis TaxID=1274662 RepID=A0ABP1FS13_9CHLO